MQTESDAQLLRDYAAQGSEPAFAGIVARHTDLVYSAAWRQTGSPELAREIAQTVFTDLARKARALASGLTPDASLTGWLYRSTRYEVLTALRDERRRQAHQRLVMEHFNPVSDPAPDWQQIAPVLDEAMAELGDADREAVLLRYFQNQDFHAVGRALGVSDDAAQKRVSRAVERLREFLAQRGVTLGAQGLVVILGANAVQAAPAGLSAAMAAAALAGKTIVSTATAATTKGLALTTWQTISILAFLVLAVTAPLYLQHRASETRRVQLVAQFQPGLSISAIATNVLESDASHATRNTVGLNAPRTNNLPLGQLREPLSTNAQFSFEYAPGALAIQPDGKILAATVLGGWFIDEQSSTLGFYGRGAMRFEADGSLDRSFYCDVGRSGSSLAYGAKIHLFDDGRIFISGSFHEVDGKPRSGHAILLPDGRMDESFDPWRESLQVSKSIAIPRTTYSSAVLSDGSIAVISWKVVEEPSDRLNTTAAYRLDASGKMMQPSVTSKNYALDQARPSLLILRYSDTPLGVFPEVPLELIRYAVRLPDGGAVLAVRDAPYWGVQRASLRRFDKDWRLDTNFTNYFEAHRAFSDLSLHVQKDGKVLVAGMVGTMNGEDFTGLARLDQNGTIDHSFRCSTENSPGGRVMGLAIQPDGRIVICGDFTQVNGIPAQHLARLNPDGSLDRTFQPPFLPMKELDRRRFLRVARLPNKDALGATSTSVTTNLATVASDATAPETILITSMKVETGTAIIHFTGQPGQLYILQARDTMNATVWVNADTNRANLNGSGMLRDQTAGKSSMRFYHVATP